MIDFCDQESPAPPLKQSRRQVVEVQGKRMLRRLRLLDIEVSPRQALFLASYERSLAHRTAMDRTGVFIEEHMLWLRDDEDYQAAYRHVMKLNQVHAMDSAIAHAVIGVPDKGPKPSHALMAQLLNILRGKEPGAPALMAGAGSLSMLTSTAAAGPDGDGCVVIELPAEDILE